MKKISVLLQIRTPHQNTVCTDSITNDYDNYFSNMLQTKIFFFI